jgi:oligopeptide transport system permease protein
MSSNTSQLLATAEEGTSLWKDAWTRLKRNRMAFVGLGIITFMVIIAILTPYIAPYSYETQDLNLESVPPSAAHWMGTDVLGRDLLTRIMYGGRISLAVGFLATFVSLAIGVLWGATAGFIGGRLDAIMMRIVDVLYGLPFVIFVVLLMVVFGRNFLLLFFAIGCVEWLTMARIVRGQVLSLKKQEFIEASIAMGLTNMQIILRHLIPNVLGPVIVYTTLTIPQVMLTESFLSFLGLGIQPPMSSWGSMISDGVQVLEERPWVLLFPGLVFSMTLFSLNFLGDGLRDALDPKASKD